MQRLDVAHPGERDLVVGPSPGDDDAISSSPARSNGQLLPAAICSTTSSGLMRVVAVRFR